MKNLKRTLSLLLAGVMLTAAAGCGGEKGDTESGGDGKVYSTSELLPEINAKGTKVTVLTHWSKDEVKNQEFNANLKTQYGVDVEYITVDWNDLGTRLTSMVLSNMAPDIYIGRYKDYPLIATKNLVQPLDGIIDFSNPLFDYTKDSQSTVQSGGKNYAVTSPDRVGWIVWYNEKMFSEAGLDTPRELYWNNNWNWDTFLNAAKELTDSKNGVYGVGATGNYFTMTTGEHFLKYDSTTGKLENNLRSPMISKVMNFWGDLAQKYKVLSPDTEGIQAFTQGKLAMLMDGDWLEESQLLEQSKRNDVNFVPVPKCPDADKYYVQMDYDPLFSIPVGAKNTEGAKAYIMYQLFNRAALVKKNENEEMAKKYDTNIQRRVSVLGNDDEDLKMQASYTDLTPAHIVDNLPDFTSIVSTMQDEVRTKGTSWETLVEKNYAALQAYVDEYNNGLS